MNIVDIVDVVDIAIDITDIVTDITDIADRVLRTLRWKQVGTYKVSRGCPVTTSKKAGRSCRPAGPLLYADMANRGFLSD